MKGIIETELSDVALSPGVQGDIGELRLNDSFHLLDPRSVLG